MSLISLRLDSLYCILYDVPSEVFVLGGKAIFLGSESGQIHIV
jgi:hypothetical protein